MRRIRTGLMPAALSLCTILLNGGSIAYASGIDPQPSEAMPRVAQSLLTDVAHRGDAYVAVGDRGHVLLSSDGKTWQQVQTPVRRMLTRVRFSDASNGWAGGYDRSLLHTTDGGQTWTLRHYDGEDGQAVFDVLQLGEDKVLAAGGNGFFSSSEDNGQSWTPIQADFLDLGFHLFGLTRLNDGTLVASGERGLLARSTDHGATWVALSTPYAGSYFGALPFGEKGVLLFGMRGNIFVHDAIDTVASVTAEQLEALSMDAGATPGEVVARDGWRRLQNPEMQSFFGGTRAEDGRYVLVGVNGVIGIIDAGATQIHLAKRSSDAPLSGVSDGPQGIVVTGRNGATLLPPENLQ